VRPSELSKRIGTLLAERKQLETELTRARKLLAIGGNAAETPEDIREIGGIKFAARQLHRIPARDLRGLADDLKKKIGSGVVALVTETDGTTIGWGLTSYPSSEVELIKGKNSKELPELLGHYYGAEVIHRNNMALR